MRGQYRRARIGVVTLFILTSCSSDDPEVSSSTQGIATNLLDCTHKAVGRVFSTLAGSCTGSYIGRGWVLTAGHCVTRTNQLCCATVGVPAGCTNECQVVHGNQLSFELNGVTYHGLFSYDTGNWVRVHPEYYYPEHTPDNDIAVFRLQGMENPASWPENRSGVDQVWPMQVSAQKPVTSDEILYIGYGPSSWNDSDYQRRRTEKTVGQIWASSYEVSSGDPVVGGDSGGPSLKNEQIVGVHSTDQTDAPVGPFHGWINGPGGCDGCLSGLTFPPPASYDPEDRKTPFCTADDDGDGVPQWRDNCPDDRNPDQMNCNARDDPALHGKLLGDACDPTPCLYIPAVRRVNTSSASGFHMSAGKARVYYRGVKKTAAASEARDVDAYYCGCHDPTAVPYDPQNPKVYSRSNCVLYGCPDDGFAHHDPKKDTGYDRILWSLGPGQSCPREDRDGNGVFNECRKPVPAQPAPACSATPRPVRSTSTEARDRPG